MAPIISSKLSVLLLVASANAASLYGLRVSPAVHKLRGGADLYDLDEEEDDPDVSAGGAELPQAASAPKALNEKEIQAKLDEVPAFVLVGDEGGFVGLTLRENNQRAIVFFTDPDEAEAVLNMTQEMHEGTPMKLMSVGLGFALKLCGGLGDDAAVKEAFGAFDGTLKLQSSHAMSAEVEPKLKGMLETAGIEMGSWALPIFICEELQGPAILPVFLHPREIREAWLGAGREEADLPKKFVMMDIRILVKQMGQPVMPWDRVRFVGSPAAVKLANSLQAELKLGQA